MFNTLDTSLSTQPYQSRFVNLHIQYSTQIAGCSVAPASSWIGFSQPEVNIYNDNVCWCVGWRHVVMQLNDKVLSWMGWSDKETWTVLCSSVGIRVGNETEVVANGKGINEGYMYFGKNDALVRILRAILSEY